MSKHTSLLLCILFLLTLAGCSGRNSGGTDINSSHAATTSSLDDDDSYLDEAYESQLVADPLEGWNRAMFVVNDKLVTFVARPLSNAYTTVTPQFFREGTNNFFTNLLFPVRFVNNLLQGKGTAAGQEFGKFFINTTAGIGGVFNVAAKTHPELSALDTEDFGQTLGVWGMSEGVYLYWPLLGPSSVRDSVGQVGDWAADPLTWLKPVWASYTLKGVRAINSLEDTLDLYDSMTKSAIEPYTAIRDAFTQYRRAKIAK